MSTLASSPSLRFGSLGGGLELRDTKTGNPKVTSDTKRNTTDNLKGDS